MHLFPEGWTKNLLIIIRFWNFFWQVPKAKCGDLVVASEELWSAVIISSPRSEFDCMHKRKFWFMSKADTNSVFGLPISGLFTLINSKLNFLLIANERRGRSVAPRPELDRPERKCFSGPELGHPVVIGHWNFMLGWRQGLWLWLGHGPGMDPKRAGYLVRVACLASRPLTFKLFVRNEKMPPNKHSPMLLVPLLLLSRDVSKGQNTNKERKIIKNNFSS